MACGEEGTGRLTQPEDIVTAVMARLFRQEGALAGRHALVTSGPTIEPIDSVRYIANRSSGKQGHAIAAALAARGAKVTLVSGPVDQQPPADVTHIAVETARDMLAACEAALPADIAVCAAAVADWRVKPGNSQPAGKLKKQEGPCHNCSLSRIQTFWPRCRGIATVPGLLSALPPKRKICRPTRPQNWHARVRLAGCQCCDPR